MRGILHIAIAGVLGVAAVSAENSTVKCAKGLKMFVSRGTGEPTELGVTKALVDKIANQIQDSSIQPILYPATFDDPAYTSSVANGTRLVRKAITEYASACPNSKMAWFGYSQGAQITSNNFCGMPVVWGVDQSENVTYTPAKVAEIAALTQPLSRNITKNVISVVLFGDPSQRNDTSYNHGTWKNTGNGMFYRSDTSACKALGSRIRAYCDAGDPFCDLGPFFNATAHGNYVENYGDEVIKFVVGQYKNATVSGSATSETGATASGSGTASPTPTNGAIGSRSMSVFPLAGLLLFYFSI